MLATDPAKAVSEVAHELMHAAHAGLIWPDEPLIGRALELEVGVVAGVRFFGCHGGRRQPVAHSARN